MPNSSPLAPRLDHAVGVEDDRRAGRQLGAHLLVRLRAHRSRARARRSDSGSTRAVGQHEPRLRMAGARAATRRRRGSISDVRHRDELADRDLPDDDLVRVRRGNRDGSGCSRASERKTNFAIAMSAVASIPCPVTSPSTTASRPSGELEEVEDVAADVDLRRGLVDRPDLEPGDVRLLARQQRLLHRLGELLLLLVEPRVVDRERGLLRDRRAPSRASPASIGSAGSSERIVS